MDGADGVADDHIARGFFDDGKRLQNGHTAADERAQGSREARDGHLADYWPDNRHLQLEFIPDMPAEFCLFEENKQDDENSHDCQGHQDVVFDGAADAEHKARKGGQGTSFTHADENLFERGDDLDHQDHQNGDRDDQDGHRIEHGGDDLTFDLLRLFHELG